MGESRAWLQQRRILRGLYTDRNGLFDSIIGGENNASALKAPQKGRRPLLNAIISHRSKGYNMDDPQEQAGQETPVAQSQTAEEPDNTGQRAAAGEDPQMPDRAQEQRVDVPQNESPVAETAPEATPTDAGTPTGDASPGGTAGGTTGGTTNP